MIEKYQHKGTEFVHIVDLDGAKGDFSNQQYIVDIIRKTDMKVQYGGGVRSIDTVKQLIDAGIHRVVVGTQAITDPDFLPSLSKEICGREQCSDQVVIAIDVLHEVIKYAGWTQSSPVKLEEYVYKCLSLGFFRFLCTDIERDGKLAGVGVELYEKLLNHSPLVKLIASGGIASMSDVMALQKINVEACIVGKAIYEKHIAIDEIKDWNLKSLISF